MQTRPKLQNGVKFPANTADIISKANGAWVRLIHGAVAGGTSVKIVYASESKDEKLFEIELPATETLDIYRQLMQSENSNARQSGILALRWWPVEKKRKELAKYLKKALQDSACGVRGASAWVIGQLEVKEAFSSLKDALKTETDSRTKRTMETILKNLNQQDFVQDSGKIETTEKQKEVARLAEEQSKQEVNTEEQQNLKPHYLFLLYTIVGIIAISVIVSCFVLLYRRKSK